MLYYNSNIIFIYAKGNITCKSTVMLMNTLAILRGTFGNFRPLSLTTSTCVNLHRDLYHYLERALSPTCEHYNVNGHPRNPLGYFR